VKDCRGYDHFFGGIKILAVKKYLAVKKLAGKNIGLWPLFWRDNGDTFLGIKHYIKF
jgi:hypothetical protein